MHLKKVLAMTAAACLMSLSAYAAQVNTIIDTGSGMWAEPEKVYAEVDDTVKGWFGMSEEAMENMNFKERMALKDKSGLTFIPTSDSDAVVQVYREEKGNTLNEDTMVTGTQTRDVSMTKDDLAALSKELGADYIFYFRVTNSMPTFSAGFFSAGQKVNVTTDFRIWDAKQAKYVFMKRYQTTGSSKTIYVGGAGSTSHAVQKGLEKALKKIGEDKAQIIAAVH